MEIFQWKYFSEISFSGSAKSAEIRVHSAKWKEVQLMTMFAKIFPAIRKIKTKFLYRNETHKKCFIIFKYQMLFNWRHGDFNLQCQQAYVNVRSTLQHSPNLISRNLEISRNIKKYLEISRNSCII